MASFQEGNLRGLITTDIMARGDISNITHVVILKCQKCLYMHHLERADTGTAISLIAL
jgi:ATP-dependent RNA helicase RhlE